MSVPDNIAFFNQFVLALLDRLYSSFPVPLDLDVKAIASEILSPDSGLGESWNAFVAADDAVGFLAEEGFLTHKGTLLSGGTFLQARLTLKGLAILGFVPEALEGKQPLIARIRGVLRGGAKEAGSEAVKQIVQQAFAAALAAGPAVASRLIT